MVPVTINILELYKLDDYYRKLAHEPEQDAPTGGLYMSILPTSVAQSQLVSIAVPGTKPM